MACTHHFHTAIHTPQRAKEPTQIDLSTILGTVAAGAGATAAVWSQGRPCGTICGAHPEADSAQKKEKGPIKVPTYQRKLRRVKIAVGHWSLANGHKGPERFHPFSLCFSVR
ncbi:uncharacterized protein N7469_004504 [Penicillium citrinum]|uniref:Uncharacterized protein n=2 Tax=Penicillium TaxID=5073 RepID=A0A9W9P4J8_PENCI|nr:uncharacterized protein N7469_004504 [Penicillium citrinum]KAJ5235336.1 hypothetical protein N7469_004504 [Penicillium citrinum]KAJ5590965.1 hypothetical protein N7450_004937 [Penicillium hetheringtonii]KAK5800227.1 hypothetical protein VI817_002439 [Penicillium citrinum]